MAEHVLGRTIRTYISEKLDAPTDSDWKKVGCSTSDAFTTGSGTDNEGCKDTDDGGVWEDTTITSQNWSMTVDKMVLYDAAADTISWDKLHALKIAGTPILLKRTTNRPGDGIIQGKAVITEISEAGEYQGKATISISFAGKGAYTATLAPTT